MQLKKAGFLTKIVILTLLIAASVTLLSLQRQITQARSQRQNLERQVAQQVQLNTELQQAVENSGDPERQAQLARSELGYVSPGEKVIIFTD
jgi:cell division protein FtsL